MDVKLMAQFPPGEAIVSMVQFKGRVLVATSVRVYQVIGDKLVPLVIERLPCPEPQRRKRANVVRLIPRA